MPTTSWISCAPAFSHPYFSIGNIYAILDLECVIPISSALAHRASSVQFVLQDEKGNDGDRDGEGMPWHQIDVWWRLSREARVVWEPRRLSPWQIVVTMS